MLTFADLKELAAHSGSCLTILQPLRDEYSQVGKPVTRITAAIQDAGRRLARKGFTAAAREEMLRPLLKVAANTDWKSRKGSVALFRAPGFTRAIFWPETLLPQVRFSSEFFLLPLLPAMLSNRDFWLVSLSIHAVRLFRGSRTGLLEIPLPSGVPHSVAECGAFDAPDHTLRGRANAGPAVGSMKGVQFGMMAAPEVKGEYLHDFFKIIDRGIRPVLARDPHPLLLAGVSREVAMYRKINTYLPILPESIPGSSDGLAPDELCAHLHAHAQELIAASPAKPADETLTELDSANGRGLLVMDPGAVLHAARQGRVRELLMAPDAAGFERKKVSINRAVVATLRHNGRIVLVPAEQMKQAAEGVAAVLRFQLAANPAPQADFPAVSG